jgi:hypothetical protein
MNCYVLMWSAVVEGTLLDRQEVINFIDSVPEIVNWRASTGGIFLVSNASPKIISTKINAKFPKLTFIISPIAIQSTWGWADKETWDFIRNPQPVGK